MDHFRSRTILPAVLASCLMTVIFVGAQVPPSRPLHGFFAIITSDLDTAIQWYTCAFGMEVDNRTELPDRGLRQANLAVRGLRLELIEMNGSIGAEELLSDREGISLIEGFFKTGFTVKRFDRWLEQLQACGTMFRGDVVHDPATGKRMIVAMDPDGNRIQFFER